MGRPAESPPGTAVPAIAACLTSPPSRPRECRRRCLRRLAGLAVSLPGALVLGGCGVGTLFERRQPRIPRIGYLDPGSKDTSADKLEAFSDELRGLGYGTFDLQERYVETDQRSLEDLADELVDMQLDVIVAFSTRATGTLKQKTATVPIVIAASSDPVGSGLVKSLSQPGANVTGLTSMAPLLTRKRLELLHLAFPAIKRVAYLMDPYNPGDQAEKVEIWNVYQQLGLDSLVPVDISPPTTPRDIQQALSQALAMGAQALITFANEVLNRNPRPIVEFAAQHRLPGMYAVVDFVAQPDGLMAYGPDYRQMYRRAAVFVDKILKGRSPAELPVERPRRFPLLLNRQAVQTQGFLLPQAFLAMVDEVV